MKREIKFRTWDKESEHWIDIDSLVPELLEDMHNEQTRRKTNTIFIFYVYPNIYYRFHYSYYGVF